MYFGRLLLFQFQGKMKDKSRFQKELERHASKQIILTILTGCLFFCIAMLGSSKAEQKVKQEEYLNAVAETFREIWTESSEFLTSEENTELFLSCAQSEKEYKAVQYQLSKFNLDTPVRLHLIVTDRENQVKFSSFTGEDMNLHRLEFNRAAAQNALYEKDGLYSTVYFFSGHTSEYVLVRPLYQGRTWMGTAAAYLEASDWDVHFQKYQYDVILTNENADVLYCSNTGFLEGFALNKYRGEQGETYQWFGDSRYLTDSRYLPDIGVRVYSFIYSPDNRVYLLIGILVILSLGLVWSGMFFHLMHAMAAKTSQSVERLVREIRIIRKEDPRHVIRIETGDELEEIAGQINKMVWSINDLNQKNLDLANVNNRMEIQNLQAQINPHFIYNTLDNIRYLIAQDAKKADELIERFTHILRYSINNTKNRTFLQEDMECIEDYLVIQKTRFGERFRYSVDIAEECLPAVIPKLLLQPLIENSIKYGFRKKADICVQIRGWMEGEYLILQVEDDGPGQPQSTVETLRSILKSGQLNTAHNGLQNINRRIILEYGRDSGVQLESKETEGFLVTLRLWTGEEESHV